jgi:hypothetical protein
MRKFFNSLIRALLLSLCALLIWKWMPIGPGSADFTAGIINEYYYSNAGGDERSISRRIADERILRGVIDARVDQYEVVDSVIHVARRPRVLVVDKEGFIEGKLTKECELYVIDTITTRVIKVTSDEYVRCGE